MTYINSSFFSVLLLPVAARRLWASGGSIRGAIRGSKPITLYAPLAEGEDDARPLKLVDEEDLPPAIGSPRSRLLVEEPIASSTSTVGPAIDRLDTRQTAWLSFEFCILWVRNDPAATEV